jgi:excinuclease ABC subunit B
MYADNITDSMQSTIDETLRRRSKQLKYNEEHHITPQQIKKDIKTSSLVVNSDTAAVDMTVNRPYIGPSEESFAADPIVERMTRPQLEKSIERTTKLMKEAAKELDFIQAAQYRDEIVRLQKQLELK